MSVKDYALEKLVRENLLKLKKAGWNLRVKSGTDEIPPDAKLGPVFYLCNVENGHIFCVGAIKGLIERGMEMIKESQIPYDEICNNFGSIFNDICENKTRAGKEDYEMLALASAAYISGTTTYKIVREEQISDAHYIVMFMHDHSRNMPYCRPLAINGNHIYSSEEIAEMVNMVLDVDMKNHPERFKSAKIYPFSVKDEG